VLFSFEASLPHVASAPQISQNHGLQTVTLLRSLRAIASANICYALQRTVQHVLPYFIRSELQEKKIKDYGNKEQRQNLNIQIKKAGKGLTEKRAWVFCLVGGSFFLS
jgi:hypothetical protein